MDPSSDKGLQGDGPGLVAGARPAVASPVNWRFHLNDTCEANLVWRTGRGGLLVRRTQRAGFAKRESGSGRLEEPALSSAPGIKCRLKRKHSFHHPLPPSLGSLGPFTRLLPQILSGGACQSSPSQLTRPPQQKGFREVN